MAIYHCSTKPVSRRSGRSAVAAAAYRAGERLENARDGLVHDFTRRDGIVHAEIVLPQGVAAEWAKDRSALWNAAEHAEKRSDARVAREFEIALPHELSADERVALARSFAQDLADRTGAAVDVAVHTPHRAGDVRNHHAHLLMTTRQVMPSGLGEKTALERENRWLLAHGLPSTDVQLVGVRQAWEAEANAHLARAGLEERIDHRSHAERGLELAPTEHVGVQATQMRRRGEEAERARLDARAAERNTALIRERPERVLDLITGEKSVFDRHDVARALHRAIDDPGAFQGALAAVIASPELVALQPERTDPETGAVTLARYATREMVALEAGLAAAAERMHAGRGYGVDRRHRELAIARQDAAIRVGIGEAGAGLSQEQRRAVGHVTGPERIAAVVGFAGAGKSTMLAAAREAWEAQGYRVHGAALSGKAAEGLEQSSGIRSRTLASWSRGWDEDRHRLGRGDVLVVDEAGMVGSRQLARVVAEAEARGAKLVLVGDHEQLQAIGAGAPFRAVAERIGHAELTDIRRQRAEWQREASVAFATHRTAEGLAAYRARGAITFEADGEAARGAIVRDYLMDREGRPTGSQVVLAHRRADVRALNDEIRAALQERGALARGEAAGELGFQTRDGERRFAPGDRIVFLENDRGLGVKNGMLGTVEAVSAGSAGAGARIVARLDGRDGAAVTVPLESYAAVDHGYATTIHKSQGATVDRAYVLASATMDRHLSYVAMTRHRDGARLYAARDGFADPGAGRLVAHGAAPYRYDPRERASYFVTLEDARGERHTRWGRDLARAMAEAAPAIGATVALEPGPGQRVRLADGQVVERQSWRVVDAEELAWRQLARTLSRSGAKETVLDYAGAFAARRGIAEVLGIRGGIALPVEAERPARSTRADHATGTAAQTPSQPAVDRPQAAERPRRNLFAGLKLKTAALAPKVGGVRPATGEAAPPAPDRLAERMRATAGFDRAVEGFALAHIAAERQRAQGLPMLQAQERALEAAGQALERARPGARALIGSALQHDPEMARALTGLSGRERVQAVTDGLERERAAQADPQVRADRFARSWGALAAERDALARRENAEARERVESRMQALEASVERDPQLAAALRGRQEDLGIRHGPHPSEDVAEVSQRSLDRSRGQGLRL